MLNGKTFEDIMIGILRDYYSVYNLDPVNANYKIVDDMVLEYTKLRPDHTEKEPQKVETLNSYNGNMVPPTSVDGTFTILINRSKLLEYLKDGNMTWVGTIVHETTHVCDFIDYSRMLGASDYEDILNIEKNVPFHLWTEFNARAKGYYFVRKYTFQNMFDIAQVNDIVNTELPMQERLLSENYHRTNDGFQQAYYVSHFLGRLYSLQMIFPSYFTDGWIRSMPLLSANGWMNEWYWFLKENNTLELAYPRFEEMKRILRKNFGGI